MTLVLFLADLVFRYRHAIERVRKFARRVLTQHQSKRPRGYPLLTDLSVDNQIMLSGLSKWCFRASDDRSRPFVQRALLSFLSNWLRTVYDKSTKQSLFQ